MRQSHYLTTTLRQPPKDEPSINAQLLTQGAFIDKLMAGVYTYLPLGWRVLQKIAAIIRHEMGNIGGQELFMPALHPLENYQKTGRDTVDVLYHLTSTSGKKMVLGLSHEEVIVPLAKKYIASYKDLPRYLYQIQVKFRDELRAKSGILRSREFMMKDLYSFHRDESDLDAYYETAKKAYRKIFEAVGIGDSTYLTYASGGTFSQFSHEFQTVTPAGEDTIHLCEKCGIAINHELIDQQKTCPQCGSADLKKVTAVEVGNIFLLKSRFSEAFDLRYTDEKGQKQSVMMGCYGIGLGRLMGAIVEIHHDSQGIIWPKSVAPFQAHLLCLSTDATVRQRAEQLYATLQEEHFDVLYDDRLVSPGIKLKDADLYGMPVRLVISEKTASNIEIKYRHEPKARITPVASAIKELKELYQ